MNLLSRRPCWPSRSFVAALSFVACGSSSEVPPPAVRPVPALPAQLTVPDNSPAPAASLPASAVSDIPASFDWTPYPWLAELPANTPPPVVPLSHRFPAPEGFRRVELPSNSFGAWLRGLPLADPSTPVRSFQGVQLYDAHHHAIAAVAALDVGHADLQQCADSVIRLHAEWRWSLGDRRMSYRAASGASLPYERWARGERVQAFGNRLSWILTGTPSRDHRSFRKYLDMVFTWANTSSLARDARAPSFDQLRPGDFFVLPGNPGHAVLVLDLARASDGRLVALLGQGFMPAQSFHVLRGGDGSPWFPIRPADGSLKTPFWEPFPWSSLRRLDE